MIMPIIDHADIDVPEETDEPVRLVRCASGDIAIINKRGELLGFAHHLNEDQKPGTDIPLPLLVAITVGGIALLFCGLWKFAELLGALK